MKLLIVTQKVDENDDVLGFFHPWVEEFAKHCERVTVICLQKGAYHLPNNVKVLSLGKEEGVSRLTYLVRFYRYIWSERKNYDNVFVHMNPIYVVLGGVFWKIWKKKISLWYTHKNVDLKLRIAEKLADIIFTASKESFRLKSKKVKIMGHGIDVEKFKPNSSKNKENKNEKDVFKIITVGRISPVKDYETLISAVDIIVQKNIPIQVDIVGDAGTPEQKKYLANIKDVIKNKNLENTVSFIGPVANKDIPQYLQKSDMFASMSHTGSLDKAVLESMAIGIPVVTCNEALPDVFGSEKDKLMFKKGDAGDFAGKIINIINMDSGEYYELSRNLRSVVVEKHNIKNLINKLTKELK